MTKYHTQHPVNLFVDLLGEEEVDMFGYGHFSILDQLPASEAHEKLLANWWTHVEHESDIDTDPDGSVFITLWSTYKHPEIGKLTMESAIGACPDSEDPFTFKGDTADVVAMTVVSHPK